MLNNILEIIGWQISDSKNFSKYTATAKPKY
jgi:hypothetical protein